MAIENLRKQFFEYVRDMKSLPRTSPVRSKIKEKMRLFLKEVRDTKGQELVDKICNPTGKINKSGKQKNRRCRYCEIFLKHGGSGNHEACENCCNERGII